MDDAIYNEVTTDAFFSTELDAGGGRFHIYPSFVPEATTFTKAVTYKEVETTQKYPTLKLSLYQFNCIASKLSDANEMGERLLYIFDDRSDTMLGGVFGIRYAAFISRTQLYDDNAKMWIVSVDIRFKY